MLWISKGPVNVRIRSTKINELSTSLSNINIGITFDFIRKCRSMQELSHWKITVHARARKRNKTRIYI